MGDGEWLFTTVGASPGSLFCIKNRNSLEVFKPRTNSDHNCFGGLAVVFIHSFGIFVKRAHENRMEKKRAESRNTNTETDENLLMGMTAEAMGFLRKRVRKRLGTEFLPCGGETPMWTPDKLVSSKIGHNTP